MVGSTGVLAAPGGDGPGGSAPRGPRPGGGGGRDGNGRGATAEVVVARAAAVAAVPAAPVRVVRVAAVRADPVDPAGGRRSRRAGRLRRPPRGRRRFLGRAWRGAPRKEVGRKRSIIWRLRRPIFLIGLAMLAMLAGVGVVVARTELPEFDDLVQASYICAATWPRAVQRPTSR